MIVWVNLDIFHTVAVANLSTATLMVGHVCFDPHAVTGLYATHSHPTTNCHDS